MEYRVWRRRTAGLLLLALFLLAGCSGSSREGPVTVRIGVALYQQDDTFISTVVQHLEQFAREEEQARDIKLNLNVADGRGSQSAQNEQVDRFLSQGYDVICVNIVDRTAAAVIIDKAKAAGVPVLFFNREPVEEDLARWEGAYYVGSDGAQSGQLQGGIVLDAWRADPAGLDRSGDGVLQYVMLEGEPGHQDALLRTEYSVKTLTQAGVATEKLANDTANWQRGQAAARMQLWLEEFGGQIEAVFANNDDMALGAISSLQTAGYNLGDGSSKTIPVFGVDAIDSAKQAIDEGKMTGTIMQDAAGMAETITTLVGNIKDGAALMDNTGDLNVDEGVAKIRVPYGVYTAE